MIDRTPGFRFFWDFDLSVSRLCGAAPLGPGEGRVAFRRRWVPLDPTLRVIAVTPFAADRSDIATLLAALDALPPPDRFAGCELQAPVILLPNLFEPELWARLIAAYEAHGGEEPGLMREVDGRTVAPQDPAHKRRRDHVLVDEALKSAVRARFLRRVVPEIRKVHQFAVTRMERYLVACDAAEDGGRFRAHRDNTTSGVAHRRFAASVNLDSDFDGGDVSFPAYGPRRFRPPPGGRWCSRVRCCMPSRP